MNQLEWKSFRTHFLDFLTNIEKYINYLNKKKDEINALHASMKEARTPIEDGICFTVETQKSATVPSLAFLERIITDAQDYEPVMINDLPELKDLTPPNRWKLIEKLKS